jgi:hypothetical protein
VGHDVKTRAALIAASATVVLGALLMPGSAGAASPVLEFVAPGGSLPVSFTSAGGPVVAELAGFETVVHCAGSSGEGEITGPRATVSKYEFTGCVASAPGSKSVAKCKSEDANPEEIRTGPIAAELVYLDRAKREVGILVNPGGGIYMSFECGGESTEARGPFLSSVTPVNEEASSFTATLTESAAMQTPDEYENAAGEKRKATPEGKRGSHEWVTTGVATTITVHPSVSVEIRAIAAEEAEAKQREEEARQREQRRHEEEASAAASAKRHQEEEAAAKKHHEEEIAAASKRQEEERAATQKREEEALTSLRAAISRALTARGRLGVLLKHGGLTLAFNSSEPGTLVIQWWRVPPGAHLAKNGKPKPTLVAQGETVFSGAGVDKVKIRLTREGRRLLAHPTKLKLTTRVRFTPTAHPTISATGAITFRR